ncbi:penicillin-binding protein 1A [Halalkalibacterium halodurans]|uniref:penicillin-binding protein 1A n=1 Tax=Halalkalibacterium halodurans TaxID=86665 RepID=UPI002E23F978|nr:penicillin-binding protein 1A [Halalkalibacterium halodurans]
MEVVIQRKARKRWRLFRLWLRLLLIVLVLGAGSAVSLLSYIKMQGPPPLQVSQTTVLYGHDMSVIGEHHQGQQRYWVALDEISPYLKEATISIEDRKFYQHHGFDLTRIGGAVVANLRAGSMAQGASTITQQYARNLYLGHDKTWNRKAQEALYALRLEMHYTKDDILEGYLNTIYYGHGAYGIEAAAQHFFEKKAADLTLAEASMLAGVPKGPSYYSPLVDEERAKARQEIILQSMVENGYITAQEAEEAINEALDYVTDGGMRSETIGPYFQDVVEEQLVEEVGLDPALLESGGLHIYTTLDPHMQEEAERWVEVEMPDSDLQVALVAIDPSTGDVRALVGGKNYGESSFNRATKARRSPGSSFKPFLYYAALEQGFTPASTLISEPTTFSYDQGRSTYSPRNFQDRYKDDFVTLLQALAFSDNIFAVKTHMFLGTDELVETARRFGIESPLRDIPSLALGTLPVGVLELTKSYVPFANNGFTVEPRFITKVVDRDGNVLYEQMPETEQTLDPRLTFIMADLMTAMFDPSLNDYMSVTGSSVNHLVNRPVAGKSGSTSTDSWMVGFTPQLVTGVWIGYDQSETLNHGTEGQVAKRIWANFTEHALENELMLQFRQPPGVVSVNMNPSNGFLANDVCPNGRKTFFVEGTEPTEGCPEEARDNETDAIDEENHEKERFLDRFIRWFH